MKKTTRTHMVARENEGGEKAEVSSKPVLKKKKHKHQSKHKRHRHSPEVKDRRHKHRHKHRRHKYKDSLVAEGAADSPGNSGGNNDDFPYSFSTKQSRMDDMALLEDLEKQRAMIKAELDSELMEGNVHSGMGLILQGYHSSSEEDGEIQERAWNGEDLWRRGQ